MALFNRKNPDEEQPTAQQDKYGVAILLELNRSGRHIYEGTVGRVVRDRRRAVNKRARQARAAHRRAARR